MIACSREIEARVEALLDRMSLADKLGQLNQGHGDSPENLELAVRGKLGSVLNVVGAKSTNAMQKAALSAPAGIPLIIGRDVIHGFRTVFPIPLAQAATWSAEAAEEAAAIAAAEAASFGVNWTFTPMMDIARDCRWGRIAESLGEDPCLAGELAAAMVRGLQGRDPDDLAAPERIAACAKHFVGYGAAEGGREYNTAEISERNLREVYLPPFQAAVDAGCTTLMSAFNEISGVPATGNTFALNTVLRGEWGFLGFVVSDWGSVVEMIQHGTCADEADAARKALCAGVDMEMVSQCYEHELPQLLASGAVSMRVVDEAVRRILRVKFALGLFEQPYVDEGRAAQVILHADHRAKAREVAASSVVLLRNEGGVLPLAPSAKRLAVVGPLADAPAEHLGCWAFDGQAEDVVTPLAALRAELGASHELGVAPGLDDPRSQDQAGFAAAVEAAEQADVVLFFGGEPAILSGEAHSRAFLGLPGAQEALLDQVLATGKPVVLVLFAGRPLPLPHHIDRLAGLLMAWHLGSETGPALVELLTGTRSPSGRLPVTWPRTVGQLPLYYNTKHTGRPPLPGCGDIPVGTPLDPVGFCTGYLDLPPTPQFPFGFGLTYTSFSYADLAINPAEGAANDTFSISATITNTGERTGTEQVQLYLRDPVATVTRPVRELRGHQAVKLAPGESRRITFVLSAADLAFHDEQMRRVVEPGEFQVWIAPDAARGIEGRFLVTGTAPMPLDPIDFTR